MNTAARSEEQARALAHLAPMAMQAQAYAALSKPFQAKYGRRRCYASQGAANAYDMGWCNWPSDPRGAFDGPEAAGFFDRESMELDKLDREPAEGGAK